MKKKTYSPYATNRGGKIEAPRKSEGEPKASVIKGDDLRKKGSGK